MQPKPRTNKVTWTVDDEQGSDSTLFHVDLYDCGDDQFCSGGTAGDGACGVGEFVLGLCPEEGCYTTVSTASVSLPEVCVCIFFRGGGNRKRARDRG